MNNKLDLKGIVSLRTEASLLPGMEKIFDLIVNSFINDDTISVCWIDDGITAPYFELLAKKIENVVKEKNLSQEWARSSLNVVRYVECLDLKGVLEQIKELDIMSEKQTLIVIVNLNEMFNRLKLSSFNESHSVINNVMLKLRKITSEETNGVILLDIYDCKKWIMDFYLDKQYKYTKKGLNEVF